VNGEVLAVTLIGIVAAITAGITKSSAISWFLIVWIFLGIILGVVRLWELRFDKDIPGK